MNTYFSGKSVLITGASSGLGAALSYSLAKKGAKLILVARSIETLDKVKDEIGSLTEVETYSLDIRDETAVQNLAANIDINSIDLLINNAGIVCCDQMENLSDTDFKAMMDTNCLGQIWMTRAVLPIMKTRKSGHIVNIASMAGVIGIAGYTAYSASKYALVGFTESLRNELAGSGIAVTLVLPSDMDTPQFHQENLTKPKATKALSGSITPLSAGTAAEKILVAIAKSKKELVISPPGGRLFLCLYRLFPALGRALIDHKIKRFNQ